MAAIIVRQQRISRIAAQGITTLRVLVDRSLASAGGPGAGTVLTVPVTVETASILLPQITLYETATAPDQVTQGALYSTQLLDINGQVVGTVPGAGVFQVRIPATETTWNEIRESNDFLALIQSAVTNRLGLDTSPTIGQSVITVIGGASQAGLDTISLFFGSSPNPPGLRHNIATAQMEFSHDGLTWASLGSGGGSGTVTSVGLSLPGIFSVSGSPVTVSGTLTATLANQSANQVFAGPSSGGAATPTFRALVANDYPTMIGDSGAGGTKGAVPAPAAGDAAANKFLKADGTWTALASAPVTSVFGRTGAVVAANGDYSFSQISGSVADGQLSANVTLLGNSTTGTGAIVRATSPTIVTPTIASFANATHNHENATGGGQLNATNIFNAGTVPVARLPLLVGDSGAGGVAGLAPAPAAGDAAASKFLKADGTWATVPGGGSPGGSSGQFQFNSVGSFGGATGVVYASSGAPTVSIAGQSTSQLTSYFRGPNASSNALVAIELGAFGSSGNFIEFRNSAGTALSVVDATGALGLGITSSLGGRLHVVAGASGNAGRFDGAALSVNTILVARQGSGSTGPLFEAQSSAGTPQFTIANGGNVISTLNALTTGNGFDISSNSITSGNLVSIISTSTAAALNTLTGLRVSMSGVNAASGQTVTGQAISVVNTNATSGRNIALQLTASGATGAIGSGANRALDIVAGQVVFPDGSNLLPSVTFNSNKASGIYSEGASNIAFVVNASHAAVINNFDFTVRNNGSLGITSATGVIGDVLWTRAANAHWRSGAADAASPVAQTLSVQNVVGGTTNTAGATWTLRGSLGTSQGVPGRVHIQAGALIAASGSTQQTPVDREIFGASKVLANNTTTTVCNVTVANNTAASGIVDYTVEVFDGTDLQIETGQFIYQVTNKGGVIANNTITSPTGFPKNVTTSGTLAVTWSISNANPALLQINANSSLTPSTGYPRVTYNLRNHGQQAVAIQ